MTHEHEYEPEAGLPEPLPDGERVLWQGVPRWRSLALRVFHVRKLAVYFAVILALRANSVASDGATFAAVLGSLATLGVLFALALGALAVLAWLTAKTTAYTITDKRVVMRVGIVLSVTYNLPFKRIEGAKLAAHGGGAGDIAIALLPPDRIAWLHLWPHVRPWRVARTEPMLRSLADGVEAAAILSSAWSEATKISIAGEPREPRAAQADQARESTWTLQSAPFSPARR